MGKTSKLSWSIITFIMGLYCSYVFLINPLKITTSVLIGIPFFVMVFALIHGLEKVMQKLMQRC